MTTKKDDTNNKIHEMIYQEVNKVFSREMIVERLEKSRDEIVAKLLGMENRWGHGWEVDHCNGRMSEISQIISDRAKEAVHSWINSSLEPALKSFGLSKFQKVFLKDYKEVYERELRTRLMQMARESAHADALKLVDAEVAKATKNLVTILPPIK